MKGKTLLGKNMSVAAALIVALLKATKIMYDYAVITPSSTPASSTPPPHLPREFSCCIQCAGYFFFPHLFSKYTEAIPECAGRLGEYYLRKGGVSLKGKKIKGGY
jgi:hypothetical protein